MFHTLRAAATGPLRLVILRSAVALTIGVILSFVGPFCRLFQKVEAFGFLAMVIVVAHPGLSHGAFVLNWILGMGGLGTGLAMFVLLGLCHRSPVGQGFLFGAYVYFCALIRFSGIKYNAFFLYGILVSFQGVYTSLDNGLDYAYLLSYFQVYAWGIAIAAVCNFVVVPRASEAILRKLLIQSLQHVSTTAHLACKTYSKRINDEEKKVRDMLLKTIRTDYLTLTERYGQVAFEIRISKWTLKDYKNMISRVQGLQQSLITASSALDMIANLDPQGVNARHMWTDSQNLFIFAEFRRSIDVVVAEVIDELNESNPFSFRWFWKRIRKDQNDFNDDKDLEKNEPLERRLTRTLSGMTNYSESTEEAEVTDISERVRKEVELTLKRQKKAKTSYLRHRDSITANAPGDVDEKGHKRVKPIKNPGLTPLPPSLEFLDVLDAETVSQLTDSIPMIRLYRAWSDFVDLQKTTIVNLIKDGSVDIDDVLRIEEGLPGLQTLYYEYLPKQWLSSLISENPLNKKNLDKAKVTMDGPVTEDYGATRGTIADAPCSEALTKSYSLLFGLNQLTHELCELHLVVKERRSVRLQFYFFQKNWFKELRTLLFGEKVLLTVQEALAQLKGKKYTRQPFNVFIELAKYEHYLKTDRSLYAAKVAAGTIVYSIFCLDSTIQPFFIRFNMTSSLITVIVANSPNLGQSFFTFILQMLGTGIGSIYGMIVLYIFRHAGGYAYNPYGICVFSFPWTIFTSYVVYAHPPWFTSGLLLMMGYFSMVFGTVQEVGNPDAISIPLRFGHTMACLTISILIAAAFQLLIFRTPARHQVRVKLSKLAFGLSSYNILLQENINALVPADDKPKPPKDAMMRIQQELIRREGHLQSQLLSLIPMLNFARVESTFGRPFNESVIRIIIQEFQVILDRSREARTAVGRDGFNKIIHHDFASKLFPYRLHSQRLARNLFYSIATSISGKIPVSMDLPSTRTTWAGFEHDALVLSRRLSLTPGGEAELRESGFLRYWFYLSALEAVSYELESIEKDLAKLYGDAITSNPNIS